MAEDASDERERRKARLQELCDKRSQALRQEQARKKEQEALTTERWSGFRIVNRLIRQEKLDASMQGKDVVPLRLLARLLSPSRDKVVIAVLAARKRALQRNAKGDQFLEWTLTDLDKESSTEAGLIFLGRAMQHWQEDEQAVPGSLLAILNPQLSCRSGAIMVTFETQVIQLGTCPSFATCKALDAGIRCARPCHAEGSGYCGQHEKMSHTARQATPCRKRRRL
mmetsp:Transcript_30525/g.57144  ORF Transcript_30525/g.57144 Transcript_30525/m.57144 type:complete len:225 (+) Transcript_30525:44-718(+)